MAPARLDFRSSAAPSSPAITPLAVSPQTASELLGIRMSRIYALMRAGELRSYSCGRSRRIVMRSIEDYVARRLADSAATGWRAWQHNPASRRQGQERA